MRLAVESWKATDGDQVGIIDNKNQIEKCLNCKKPKCNNCVDKRSISKPIDEVEFYRLYNLGYSDTEMAKMLGAPKSNIAGFRWRRKLEPNKGLFDHMAVIRCKYCKNGTVHYHDEEDYYEVVCALFGVCMKMDDFCSYGERKENG